MIRSYTSLSLVLEAHLKVSCFKHLPIPRADGCYDVAEGDHSWRDATRRFSLPRTHSTIKASKPTALRKDCASGASTTDAGVAPSRTGDSTHGHGISDDPRANTVAKKAENAAAQACSKALKAMRADKAEAQEEADATYAGSLCTRAFDALTDQMRSGGRAV